MGTFLDQLVEHFVGDVFDFIAFHLTNEPCEDFFFVGQIAVVEAGNFVFEIHQGRDLIDTVLLGNAVIVDLHETDGFLVALVIHVFQFDQDALGFSSVVIV